MTVESNKYNYPTYLKIISFSFNLQIPTEKKSFDSSSQLRFDTYEKRPGTTNFGNDYEKLMCALLALKFSTSDIVADFEMKTNSDDFGDFDDVSLKVTFVDGQSQIFLLQLKHSEKMKNVTGSMLAKKKGFSILKYKESIPKFKNTENVSFILYTNSPTSVKNNSKICLQNKDNTITEEVVVRELLDLDPQKHLLINRKEISDKKEEIKVFQFESNQSSGLYNGHDDFWKRFYFFTLQTGTTGAEKLIDSMLKEKCGINDAVYSSSFIQFMETWRSGNFILTKYDVVAKLAELALTPLIQTISDKKCNKKSKLLKKAIMNFDMTIVRDKNEEVIANIWNDTTSYDEIHSASLKYGLRPKGVKDLSPKDRSKVLWHLNKVPLIVKAEECHEAQVKHAIRLLEKIAKKKVVLLANVTKDDFLGWNIFQDLSDLPNIPNIPNIYTDISKHFTVSLQGQQPISLDQLFNSDQKHYRTIATTQLVKMTQEVIQIGRSQEKAFENYISRSVSTITLDINKMPKFCKKTNSLLIICNVFESWSKAILQLGLNVMKLDEYLKLVEKNKLNKVDILLTINEWPQVPFNDICEKTKRNVHLLQVFDDEICTSILSKENRFSLETMKSEEARVNEEKIFTYLDHPLNLICSPPGMGKSTLLSRLSSICPSSYWTVRVNLINHKTFFKKECVHDAILHHFVQEDEDPLVVKIRSMLLQNKRVYFFFDGLDEIDSDCLQIALDFIKHISSLGHRVWITSRENLKQEVSQTLDIFPIKIEELTKEQQTAYIEKRLQDMYQKDEIEHITNKIYANVDIVNSRHLLGVPLQLFIVTENFRNNKNLWKKPDQEIFVLTKMYKIFFQGKKKHQHRKFGVYEHEDLFDYYFDLYLEQYELLALKSCLDAATFDKLNINLGRSQKFLEKLKIEDPFGIVSRVTDDSQAIFNHQTYAEYFACAWMKNNLDKVSLLQDDLFTKKNQNLKFMFDIMLAENSALHLAVIYRHTELVSKHLDKIEVKDEGGRSPLQLLCSYGVEHSPLSLTEGTWWFLYPVKHISDREFSKNNIEGVSTQYREILKMLLYCSKLQNDDDFRWNCLEYAIRLHNLFAVEKILERFGDSISLESLFERYDTITLAYYSSQMGYANLLRAVIGKDSNVLSVKIGTCGLTLLHVAIVGVKKNNKFEQTLLEESIKVLTTLIECGLDVDERCIRKTTSLHLASELDDDVIVKFLLEKEANINLIDRFGRNALHFALKNSKVNMGIVKLLIEKGIDAEAIDVYGKTPLHLCCREGHYDALVMLLNHGLDVQVATKYKINLLHAIFRQREPDKEMMNLVISKGTDVNGKDCYGRTALHYACNHEIDFLRASIQYVDDVNATNNYKPSILQQMIVSDTSKSKIILFLLRNSASVNAKDSANRSVLHYAAFQRNYHCIKVLLDHGADINAVCDSGKTVLHAAFEKVLSPDVVVIQLLLSHGVDSNKRDKNQKTALDYAVTSTGSRRVVNVLFDAIAHEQLMSTDYVTFLHYAVYYGNCFAVELFLNDQLDLDNVDVNNEEYPLYFAVENQHLRSELLLKMTKFIRDCKKKAYFGRKRIVELLEEYFSKGYGPDHVSFFNINLCFLFVFIFQKVTVLAKLKAIYNRSRTPNLYCLLPYY
jgi:ankyrin repeat protein/energy-coupling factor transporter ATP-binding protein EcfA2